LFDHDLLHWIKIRFVTNSWHRWPPSASVL